MRLRVLCPHGAVLEREVAKVVAEAANGFFALLPRHVDFVAALVPGILAYLPAGDQDEDVRQDGEPEEEQQEEYLAVGEGILVKIGPEVRVAVRDAVTGARLGELEQAVRRRTRELERSEERARAALARLEADFVRRFAELSEPAA